MKCKQLFNMQYVIMLFHRYKPYSLLYSGVYIHRQKYILESSSAWNSHIRHQLWCSVYLYICCVEFLFCRSLHEFCFQPNIKISVRQVNSARRFQHSIVTPNGVGVCVCSQKSRQFTGTSGVLGSTQSGHYTQDHAVTRIILNKILWN